MRHDEMRLLRWRQVDLMNEAIKVGKSKTEHGAGRSVPLNKQALKTIQDWSKTGGRIEPRDHPPA